MLNGNFDVKNKPHPGRRMAAKSNEILEKLSKFDMLYCYVC